MNVINESGILAIATRLQRLSEQLRKDGFQIYKANNIDFEPKWFPVIYTLHFRSSLSVVELAAEIGYSHPATISLLKELEKEKIIRSKKDKQDERKRLVSLTEKGKKLLEQMQPVWGVMIAALEDLTAGPGNIMNAIAEIEDKLEELSFFERAKSIKKASG